MPEKWPGKWPGILLCTLLKLHISNKVEKFNLISLTEIKVNSNKTKRCGFESKLALNQNCSNKKRSG